jgi:hypothetical protein
MLTWEDIELQGAKLSTYGFITFLREACIVPQLINIEGI